MNASSPGGAEKPGDSFRPVTSGAQPVAREAISLAGGGNESDVNNETVRRCATDILQFAVNLKDTGATPKEVLTAMELATRAYNDYV